MSEPSDDDLWKVMREFIQGKRGPPGTAMARLSYEGTEPPKLPAQPPPSETYDEFAREYPHLVRALTDSNRLSCLSAIGAMLTLPELQSNCFRLESLASLAAKFAGGRRSVTPGQLSAWFSQLNEGTCGRQEDPAEDLFTANVVFQGRNYRLFEGMVEGNAFYTQIFLTTLEGTPATPGFNAFKRTVLALLKLSDAIAERAGLARNVMGNPTPQSTIGKIRESDLSTLKARAVFSAEDLAALDIESADIEDVTLQEEDARSLGLYRPGHSLLEFKPIIRISGRVVVLMPTSIGIAIRTAMIGLCLATSQLPTLERALAETHAEQLRSDRLLGEFRLPPFPISKRDGFREFEATIEYDVGRYLHLVVLLDGFEGYREGGFLGYNPYEKMAEHLENSRKIISQKLAAEPGFRDGLSLVILCGWGRPLILIPPEDTDTWRTLVISAHDIRTLGNHPKFSMLDIIRVLDSRDAMERMGVEIVNINGFLNLFAWVKNNNDHIIPHEHLDSDFVSEHGASFLVPQNSLLKARLDVAQAMDDHVAMRPDGSSAFLTRAHRTPRYGATMLAPFYVDLSAMSNGVLRCAFEGKRRNFWMEFTAAPGIDTGTKGHLFNMLDNWAEVVFRHFDTENLDMGMGDVNLLVEFQEQAGVDAKTAIPTDEEIAALIEVLKAPDSNRVHIKIGSGFLAAGRRVDNAAERALVAAMIRACAQCVAPLFGNEDIAAHSDRLTGNVSARHFHAFYTTEPRDYVKESLPENGQVISGIDDANTRLGLGWLNRDRSAGGEIRGREECCAYLNGLVRTVAESLCEEIKKFDRKALLVALMVNHEACAAEATGWHRTYKAVRALSADASVTQNTAIEKIAKLNAGSIASRLIAEIALCESPLTGGLVPGKLDIGRMLASVMQVFHLGGYSNAIYHDVMQPEIRISPAGDVLMHHTFTDKVVRPLGTKFQTTALDNSADRYEEYYATPEDNKPENLDSASETPLSDELQEFQAAWADEFSYTIEQLRTFLEAFHFLAAERREAVFIMSRLELIQLVQEKTGLEKVIIEACLKQFTLVTRPLWAKAPKGMKDEEWQPWRFRRALSLIARPFLQLESSESSECIVSPAFVIQGIGKFVNDARFGRLNERQFRSNGPMAKWIGKVNHRQGEEFNETVAERFRECGLNASANLTGGRILQRPVDETFGDVDVLAWSVERKRVLVIECKDLSLDKTTGEIAARLSRYRGNADPKGERDDLRKHLDRCEVLAKSLPEVSKFVGFEVASVESILVFSHPTPMQFHQHSALASVTLLTIDDIERWILTGK